MNPIKITIYSDYVCPFCYLGKGIMGILKGEFALEEEWLPFELHPKTPPEGIRWNDLYYGMNHESFFKNMDSKGEHLDIHFNPQPIMYNSNLALQAGEYAKEFGRHDAFHQAMFTGNFVDCRNIGSIAVIADIAARVDLDPRDLEEALRENRYAARIIEVAESAKESGINSAPTFEIQGGGRIIGPKPLEVFQAALREAMES